jgi:hypothetical protein
VVVTLVEQHRIVIKERWVLVAGHIHLVVDCSGRWHCLLGLYTNLSIHIVGPRHDLYMDCLSMNVCLD